MTDNTHRDSGITTSSEVLAYYAKTALMYEELRAAIDDGHESMTHADALDTLEAQLEAIGAGGVSGPLMGIAAPPTAQAEGWRPISTAPKDGALIVLGARNGVWLGKYLPVYQSGYRPETPGRACC